MGLLNNYASEMGLGTFLEELKELRGYNTGGICFYPSYWILRYLDFSLLSYHYP